MDPKLFQQLSASVSAALSTVATGLATAAIPIVVAYIGSWVRNRANDMRQSMNTRQLQMAQSVGAIAINAAEQLGRTGQLVDGTSKKDYAVRMAQSYLSRLGVRMDARDMAALIEAEVSRTFGRGAPMVELARAQSELLQRGAKTAVLAAEQGAVRRTAVEHGLDLGEQKKKFAMNIAARFLAEHGLRMDAQVVDAMIEAQLMQFRMEAAQQLAR